MLFLLNMSFDFKEYINKKIIKAVEWAKTNVKPDFDFGDNKKFNTTLNGFEVSFKKGRISDTIDEFELAEYIGDQVLEFCPLLTELGFEYINSLTYDETSDKHFVKFINVFYVTTDVRPMRRFICFLKSNQIDKILGKEFVIKSNENDPDPNNDIDDIENLFELLFEMFVGTYNVKVVLEESDSKTIKIKYVPYD